MKKWNKEQQHAGHNKGMESCGLIQKPIIYNTEKMEKQTFAGSNKKKGAGKENRLFWETKYSWGKLTEHNPH